LETHQKIEVGSHGTFSSQSGFGASDFHLFGVLKEVLEERRFRCEEDNKNMMHLWLCAQPKPFCYDGIKKLAGYWEKCVEEEGEYVEK
jgi:hypothetical protein